MAAPLAITHATAIFPNRICPNITLTIKRGMIASCHAVGSGSARRAVTSYLAPGFIDTHIHGDPFRIARSEIPHGMTAFVLAISCCSGRTLAAQLARAARFRAEHPFGTCLIGIRLEGPFINPACAGAQHATYIKTPDMQHLATIIRQAGPLLRIMTVAPEMPGALALVRMLAKKGVIVSLGHSDATRDDTRRSIAAGIRHITHLGNALSGDACRAALADRRVAIEMIADMVHVPAATFRRIYRHAGAARIIAITDSITHQYPRQGVYRAGVYYLPNGKKAGSALTMIEAVKHMVQRSSIPLVDAIRAVTTNPARLVGHAAGTITVGAPADLVVFDDTFNVKTTIIHGKIAYTSEPVKG